MKIVNILKDGTTLEDISGVEVPEETLKNIFSISERREQCESE